MSWLDRPEMPAAPLPAGSSAPRPHVRFSSVPPDVEATMRSWAQGASLTSVLVAMVRILDEPGQAPLRARVLADADEYAREQRRRR